MREAIKCFLARQPDNPWLERSELPRRSGIRSRSWAPRQAEADNIEFRILAPPAWFRRALTAVQADDPLAATSDPA